MGHSLPGGWKWQIFWMGGGAWANAKGFEAGKFGIVWTKNSGG